VFRSRLGAEFEPRVTAGFATIVATEHWHVLGSCAGGDALALTHES
jgi:hypothetical protein